MQEVEAILSFGSNQGLKIDNLKTSIIYLKDKCNILSISPIYETLSLLRDNQENYYNLIVVISTNLSIFDLITFIHHIEQTMGRKRDKIWASRIIDIDIIDYDNQVYSSPLVTVPHYGITERSFVLYPLKDVKPDYIHPVSSKSVSDMIESLQDDLGIKQVDEFIDIKNI